MLSPFIIFLINIHKVIHMYRINIHQQLLLIGAQLFLKLFQNKLYLFSYNHLHLLRIYDHRILLISDLHFQVEIYLLYIQPLLYFRQIFPNVPYTFHLLFLSIHLHYLISHYIQLQLLQVKNVLKCLVNNYLGKNNSVYLQFLLLSF